MNQRQLEMFFQNFNRLERMIEIPESKLDVPKMVDYWMSISKTNQETDINGEFLLNNFNDW